jgi:hypothetical protein
MSPEHDSPEAEGEPELSEIESALGSLAPTRSRVDRDLVMYQAGRTSVRPGQSGPRGWMAVAAACGLVALGEGALLARRPAERVVERIVVVREPAAPPVGPSLESVEAQPPAPSRRPPETGPAAHDRLAWQVLRYGLDGLPAPRPSMGSDRPASQRSLREEIGKVLDLGDPS